MFRGWSCLAAIGALLALPAGLAAPASGQDDCASRYTGPDTGQVVVPPPMVAGASSGFDLRFDGDPYAVINSSIRYHLDGPMGARDIAVERPEDGETGAAFTPSEEGRYTVSATWTRYDCTDIGNQTTAGGAAPQAGFEVVHGKDPGGRSWTTKRPRSRWGDRVIPGDAALHVQAKCAAAQIASRDELRIDLYWTTSRRAPTHRSRHVGVRGARGCFSRRFVRTKDFESKRINAGAAGTGAWIDVIEPAYARVLAEIRSAGRLVFVRRATIRRSPAGMVVVPDR